MPVYELLHSAYPDGDTEALLPLAQCRQHLSLEADDDSQDGLVTAFRDAAIEFVERYCSVRMGPVTGLVWRGEGFPARDFDVLALGVSPVTDVASVAWLDSAGAPVDGELADFRWFVRGEVVPAIGGSWPSGIGGGVEITFNAGFEAGQCPPSLLHAARMMLGHLWLHREAVVDAGAEGEVPLGVKALCAPFRRIAI